MSLPPQVIHIKRKRAEEPVDSLFIQSPSDHGEAKRRATHQDFVFRRLTQDAASKAATQDGIPQIRPTQPGRERDAAVGSGAAEAPKPTQTGNKSAPATPEPRRFHLTRTKANVGSDSPRRKRRSLAKQEEDVAVFVEDRNQEDALTTPSHQVESDLHKKMLAYAAEIEDDETEKSTENTSEQAKLDGDAMDTTEDYVYDTYVRHDNIKASSTMDTMAGLLSGGGQGGVGYLVITQEDQPFWETFADDEDSSEGDWDSEQDDENAENYYGADYPEDEVDSDDEHGQDAYRYRNKGASDEEEYDLGADAWSDDEALQHPWEKKTWRQAERRAHVDGLASGDDKDD